MPILALLPLSPDRPHARATKGTSTASLKSGASSVSGRAIISGENTSLCLCSCTVFAPSTSSDTDTPAFGIKNENNLTTGDGLAREPANIDKPAGVASPRPLISFKSAPAPAMSGCLAAILSTTSRPPTDWPAAPNWLSSPSTSTLVSSNSAILCRRNRRRVRVKAASAKARALSAASSPTKLIIVPARNPSKSVALTL